MSYDLANIGPFDIAGYCMYDVIDLIDKLSIYAPTVYSAVQAEAETFRSTAEKATVHYRTTNAHPNVHGLDAYFPNGLDTDYDRAFDDTRFGRDMYWDEFLHHYIEKSIADDTPPSICINEPQSDSLILHGEHVKIEGTAFDLQGTLITVQISIDGGRWRPVEGLEEWHYILDTSTMEGNHTVSVRSFDGTEYSTPRTLHFTVLKTGMREGAHEGKGSSATMIIIAVALIILAFMLWWKKERVMNYLPKKGAGNNI